MLYLITYDVPSSPAGDRRRSRVARLLEGMGLRVQYSVFEVELPPENLPRLLNSIEELIDHEEDSVRVYPLCAACTGRATRLGQDAVCEHGYLVVW